MTDITRRAFGGAVAALAVPAARAATRSAGAAPHDRPRPVVAVVLAPGFSLLDALGPHAVLAPACDVRLVARSRDAVPSGTGVAVLPTATFADCPAALDALLVPGGIDPADAHTLAFVADRGGRAAHVTAVGTGSLVLGAAGLLRGYRAACHWASRDLLTRFGATPAAERVVIDRNRVTSGGVTAGLDLGFTLLATLCGDGVAKATQLAIEYAPQPPFACGSPQAADAELIAATQALMAGA